MSVEALAWAFRQQLITDSAARFVLVGLANHADDEGRNAFPSIETLSKYSGLSRRSVIRKLQDLEEAGIIVKGNQAIAAAHIERADRRPTVYNLSISRGDALTPRSERGDIGAATGCQPCTNGVTLVQERGVTVTPEPSYEPSNEPSLKPSNGARRKLPPDFSLTEERKAAAAAYWAKKARPDLLVDDEFEKFLNHHTSRGTKMADWDAAWRTWYVNAVSFNRPPPGIGPGRPPRRPPPERLGNFTGPAAPQDDDLPAWIREDICP